MGWHEHDDDVFIGCETFFRPGYNAHLVAEWIPALDGVEAKLQAGARVADVGCGHGSSTVLMAQAYPASTFIGSDYHDASIQTARKRAADAGVADRVTFETAPAQTYSGSGYDLVTFFDCLHDMGDPLTAARHVRETLAPDGTWLMIEPIAGDTLAENLNPVGRVYYGFSTLPLRRRRPVPAGRLQPRRPGGPGGAAPGHHRRGVHAVPHRRADPVQPRLRDPSVGTGHRPRGTTCARGNRTTSARWSATA